MSALANGNRTHFEQVGLPARSITTWTLVLNDADARSWDRERLEMLHDAVWLIGQALDGRTEGPLTLPLSGVTVR